MKYSTTSIVIDDDTRKAITYLQSKHEIPTMVKVIRAAVQKWYKESK